MSANTRKRNTTFNGNLDAPAWRGEGESAGSPKLCIPNVESVNPSHRSVRQAEVHPLQGDRTADRLWRGAERRINLKGGFTERQPPSAIRAPQQRRVRSENGWSD